MGELKIKDPCKDCPLYVGSGESLPDICEQRLLPMAKDGIERALGCKHPWRVAFKGFDGKPNGPESNVLSRLAEIRHKDPADYGLPHSLEMQTKKEWAEKEQKEQIIGIMVDSFLEVFDSGLSDREQRQAVEELLLEFAGRDDVMDGWANEALQYALELFKTKLISTLDS